MTEPSRPRSRRRLTIATLLVLVAMIAFGLVGSMRFSLWWKIRKIHPDLATVPMLVSGTNLESSCIQCHGQPQKKSLALALPPVGKAANLPIPGHPASFASSDCKACHSR